MKNVQKKQIYFSKPYQEPVLSTSELRVVPVLTLDLREIWPNKNTAFLRCYWAFKTQTKLKQTDKSHKVRRREFEKRSKKMKIFFIFFTQDTRIPVLKRVSGFRKNWKKYFGIQSMTKIIGVIDIISAEIGKVFTG